MLLDRYYLCGQPHPPVSISALSDRGLLLAPSLPDSVILNQVSISALSDRGLLPIEDGTFSPAQEGFNIRSFGSWIASLLCSVNEDKDEDVSISALSDRGLLLPVFKVGDPPPPVSISALSDRGLLLGATQGWPCGVSEFQYPLFRIVDCFSVRERTNMRVHRVSISALSDRGLLLALITKAFDIVKFQYPLFRIVDCFLKQKPAAH